MPTTTIIVLSAIVCVFVIFGLVLAWGDQQTRHLAKHPPAGTPDRSRASAPLRIVNARAQIAQPDGGDRAREGSRNQWAI